MLCQAERARVTRVVLLGLSLAERVLAAPLPETVQRAVASDRTLPGLIREIVVQLHERPGLLERGALPYRLRAGMRSGLKDKLPVYLSFATRLLRPNEQDKRVVTLPKSFAAGYYFVRPLRLLKDGVTRRRR